jgi:hypothetical protein
MHTYERSLVQKFAGRPLVLVGVNADPDVETLRHSQEKDHLTWRSWWDRRGGPIAYLWGIRGFPTVFLIDQRGVIRFKSLGPPRPEELERQIALLLEETS